MANIQYESFSKVNLQDTFFDSLRQDYQGFDNWYNKKASQGEKAYILYEKNELVCFLYLKEENPVDNTGITPPLDLAKTWIKVGTLKLSYTGQSLVSVSLRECLILLYLTIYLISILLLFQNTQH
ncbi:hypothetical protein [uncultured Helicobacter sp.]|nr:hypothetical protein [uncultured Helicobacter sp.]